jgi:hypothetical protein
MLQTIPGLKGFHYMPMKNVDGLLKIVDKDWTPNMIQNRSCSVETVKQFGFAGHTIRKNSRSLLKFVSWIYVSLLSMLRPNCASVRLQNGWVGNLSAKTDPES